MARLPILLYGRTGRHPCGGGRGEESGTLHLAKQVREGARTLVRTSLHEDQTESKIRRLSPRGPREALATEARTRSQPRHHRQRAIMANTARK
ncbi:MAG TPA: hypothetical protein DEP84_14935 [Chloroflexi bacterium]|nr:hypothetical protein [Chloroflexota bacterium]